MYYKLSCDGLTLSHHLLNVHAQKSKHRLSVRKNLALQCWHSIRINMRTHIWWWRSEGQYGCVSASIKRPGQLREVIEWPKQRMYSLQCSCTYLAAGHAHRRIGVLANEQQNW